MAKEKIHNSWLKAHVLHHADSLTNNLMDKAKADDRDKIIIWDFVKHQVRSAYNKGRATGIEYGIKRGVEMCREEKP